MGVDATAVVMYGVRFDPNEEGLRDLVEAIYDANDNDMMVYDGMCGQYMVLGHIFSYQSVHGDFDYVEISVDNLKKIEDDYRALFDQGYPEWAKIFDGKEFKLLSFVHYS
jgi:hypothetical protein